MAKELVRALGSGLDPTIRPDSVERSLIASAWQVDLETARGLVTKLKRKKVLKKRVGFHCRLPCRDSKIGDYIVCVESAEKILETQKSVTK